MHAGMLEKLHQMLPHEQDPQVTANCLMVLMQVGGGRGEEGGRAE
jgi:hypothetical protein